VDWDRLRVFHAVAEAGSITHAGETLHLSQSAVSRQIQSLETAMGATLFHRHPRGLLLTSEGEILFEATQEITAQLDASTVRLRDNREGVHGPLRVTTTLGFGIKWLMPRLPKLLALHPGLSIELLLTEEVLDLAMRQADVAIRMRAPRQADVIGRKLWSMRVGLYASRTYLEQRGTPKTVEDLTDHDLIIYSDRAPQPSYEIDWLLREGAGAGASSLRPRVTVSTQFAVLEAVRYGAGIGIVPEYLTDGDDSLLRVLPDCVGPEIEPHLVYANEMKSSKRVSVFRAFLLSELGQFPN